jgi:hypothetical protein
VDDQGFVQYTWMRGMLDLGRGDSNDLSEPHNLGSLQKDLLREAR